MTTRDLAVRWTETKERKGWSRIWGAIGTVSALPGAEVAVLADAWAMAGMEAENQGCEEGCH